MTSEESKSKGSAPVETPPVEEESILNRPRPKLNLANEKKAKPKLPEKTILEQEAAAEPPKKEKLEEIKEKTAKIASEIYGKVSDGLSSKLKTGTSLKESGKIIIANSRILVFALAVTLIMIFVSMFLYHYFSSGFNSLLSGFYSNSPALDGPFDYIYYLFWAVTKVFFHAIVIAASFLIPFILSYIITSPLNSIISIMAKDLSDGKPVEGADFSFEDAFEDIINSLQVAGLSAGLILIAFFLNLIPVIGQIAAFAIFIAVFSMLINDFSLQNSNLDPKMKILWMRDHPFHCLRTGTLPAILAMLPLLNNVILALVFPVLIIHAVLNFEQIKKIGKNHNEN
ncbi:MAG TPA: EI24 domain-containing protein [bacterium]|nr:EI24 domain-containing protein [bacterium]HPS30021.1 EI24 domain-containing protein [bacterium]